VIDGRRPLNWARRVVAGMAQGVALPPSPAERTEEPQARSQGRFRIRRFDADRIDEELTWADALAATPSRRQLLWIDVEERLEADEADALAAAFGLSDRTRETLMTPGSRPLVSLHGQYVHLRIGTEPDPGAREPVQWLDIIAGRNLVITRHDQPIRFLIRHYDRIENDTTIGMIDAADFVVSLLNSSVTTYFAAIDAIEDEVDRLDGRALKAERPDDLLADLVTLRRRTAALRRVLTAHRELFSSLATPEFAHATQLTDRSGLVTVAGNFASAMDTIEEARDAVRGSFDVAMTRTAQRTNDVMKVLTLATVLLLPASLVAGLLGMNVMVPVPTDDPTVFWRVAAGMAILALTMIGVARARHWI